MMNGRNNHDPLRDRARIEEIARLRLHEDIVDEVLESYVNQAAEEFDLPIGLVSIVLNEAQKFAASTGLEGWLKEANGTPVEWSFCANSIPTKQPFIVEDAETHALVKDNPLVTEDGVRCYAGAPLITHNGIVVGNFCVIGDSTRSFSPTEVARLKAYAKEVIDHLEARVV